MSLAVQIAGEGLVSLLSHMSNIRIEIWFNCAWEHRAKNAVKGVKETGNLPHTSS